MTEQDDKTKEQLEALFGEKKLSPQDMETLKNLMQDPVASMLKLMETKRGANDEAKKYRLELEQYQKDKKDKETEDLKSQGKYKGLYESADAELTAVKSELDNIKLNTQLKVYAKLYQMVDPDFVQFINRGLLDFDSAGNLKVDSVQEAFANLRETKPHLFLDPGSNKTDKGKPGADGMHTSATDLAINTLMRPKQ